MQLPADALQLMVPYLAQSYHKSYNKPLVPRAAYLTSRQAVVIHDEELCRALPLVSREFKKHFEVPWLRLLAMHAFSEDTYELPGVLGIVSDLQLAALTGRSRLMRSCPDKMWASSALTEQLDKPDFSDVQYLWLLIARHSGKSARHVVHYLRRAAAKQSIDFAIDGGERFTYGVDSALCFAVVNVNLAMVRLLCDSAVGGKDYVLGMHQRRPVPTTYQDVMSWQKPRAVWLEYKSILFPAVLMIQYAARFWRNRPDLTENVWAIFRVLLECGGKELVDLPTDHGRHIMQDVSVYVAWAAQVEDTAAYHCTFASMQQTAVQLHNVSPDCVRIFGDRIDDRENLEVSRFKNFVQQCMDQDGKTWQLK